MYRERAMAADLHFLKRWGWLPPAVMPAAFPKELWIATSSLEEMVMPACFLILSLLSLSPSLSLSLSFSLSLSLSISLSLALFLSLSLSCIHIYVCRERERERESDSCRLALSKKMGMVTSSWDARRTP